MRKYIITPALLAIVCMVMCHCTFNRKASVAANEYLIQGELANLPDSIVIGLYEEDGNILFPRHGFYHTENADYV